MSNIDIKQVLVKYILFPLLPILVIGFFVIVLISSLLTAILAEDVQNDVSSFEIFSLSENVLAYEDTVISSLESESIDVQYSIYILSMMQVLTAGVGTDVMLSSKYGDVTNTLTSITVSINQFKTLLNASNLPLEFTDDEILSETINHDDMKTLLNNYASDYDLFAENVYLYVNNVSTGFIHPTPTYTSINQITQYYKAGEHLGIYIGVPEGEPIVAVQSGYVVSAYYSSSWGYNVLIEHSDEISTRSAHMSIMAVSAGDYVEQGQIIGYIGSTGQSTGNHIHFEVYYNGERIDPYPFLEDTFT